MVNLARKNLLHDKLRFAITVSGVAFAVTLVFVQVGLFLGLLDNASITIEKMDADLWITAPATPNVDFGQPFPETRVQRARSVPGVLRADNLIVGFMTVSLPTGAREGMVVYALENFGRWGVPWRLDAGRLEDLGRGQYMVLDDAATRRHGAFAVGEYRELQNQRLKIIGRSREARSFTTTPMAFVDFRRAQDLNPDDLAGKTTYVLVKLEPGADAAAVRAELQRRLPYNDVLTREEWAAKSRSYWTESTGIGLNMIVTVFLGCIVGVVIVAQTLYTSTMEHVKEFGTLKAIGGSNGDIYRILGEQALIAAVVGFVLGAVNARLIRPAIEGLDLKMIVPPDFAVIVFGGTVFLCLAAAMVSFRKVANIDPMLVFRS
ncbi:MAG: FtsX-like permease family protein [Planctomycetota bacterium]|nr:MAG: FtsX-like permease family protein [Planctomycetota bacterium]